MSFDATIPVVDMNDFLNEATKGKFVEGVTKALHEVGFFAVVNTGTDMEALDKGYAACAEFFSAPIEKKDECFDANIKGQRGYVHSEVAQGQSRKDHKEFFHLGDDNNLWPKWMDYEGPMNGLLATIKKSRRQIEEALSLAMGEAQEYLTTMTDGGASLMRCLHYPANPEPGAFWAAQHTDIGLFTILPRATEDGLQVFHDNKWIDVRVPANSFIINGADNLQNLTNGYFKSSLHRVVSTKNVERYSIVYFVHTKNEDIMNPREASVKRTGGVVNYPDGTAWDLLHHRLMELKLAERQFGTEFFGRIEKLVAEGRAAEPVLLSHKLWKEIEEKEKAAE